MRLLSFGVAALVLIALAAAVGAFVTPYDPTAFAVRARGSRRRACCTPSGPTSSGVTYSRACWPARICPF